MSPETKTARFSVGELVHHQLFDYRGVVIDVDSEFSGSEEWYDQVAQTRPPKDQPWYHVLVDQSQHRTYVAQRNLEVEPDPRPIRHPLVGAYFQEFKDGAYISRAKVN
jgi:heat shock protein HspQ